MRSRAVAIDVLAAAAALAVSVAVLVNSRAAADLRAPDAGAYALLVVCSISAVGRRVAPVTAAIVCLGAGVLFSAAQYPAALTPIAVLPVYTAATVLPPRRTRVFAGGAVFVAYVDATLRPGATNLGLPAVIFTAWLLGNYVGTRRVYTAELENKNRLLEQAQLELADRAVADERLRIARELHDVVAHSMSVVALHAGTGRMVADEDPAAAREALATIESATRSSLVEMQRLLGVLRSDKERSTARTPAPGLHDLEVLVAQTARTGLTVDVRVKGIPRGLPAGVDLSAYRIAQEALTNVIKHASRANTVVTVGYEPDAVTVEIVNDAPRVVGAELPIASGGGHGVVGMRERVATYGGHLEVGPRFDGGFRVFARLPVSE